MGCDSVMRHLISDLGICAKSIAYKKLSVFWCHWRLAEIDAILLWTECIVVECWYEHVPAPVCVWNTTMWGNGKTAELVSLNYIVNLLLIHHINNEFSYMWSLWADVYDIIDASDNLDIFFSLWYVTLFWTSFCICGAEFWLHCLCFKRKAILSIILSGFGEVLKYDRWLSRCGCLISWIMYDSTRGWGKWECDCSHVLWLGFVEPIGWLGSSVWS